MCHRRYEHLNAYQEVLKKIMRGCTQVPYEYFRIDYKLFLTTLGILKKYILSENISEQM